MLFLSAIRIAAALVFCGQSALGRTVPLSSEKRGTNVSTQYEETDKLGAVASESSVCSRIGVDLIKAGGNAADALVGTVFCVGVIGKSIVIIQTVRTKYWCRNVPQRCWGRWLHDRYVSYRPNDMHIYK